MIEMHGMYEEEIGLFLEWLSRHGRHVAFEGARVRSQGGEGHIAIPLDFGPVYCGRRIATLGASYRIPKVDLGNRCCPHFAVGEIVSGAPDIVYQGVPVAMVGDRGNHWPGCGTSSVFVVEGFGRTPSPVDRWDFSAHEFTGFRITAGDDPDEVKLPGQGGGVGRAGGLSFVAGED